MSGPGLLWPPPSTAVERKSNLCEKCRFLYFNPHSLPGSFETIENGGRYFNFPLDQQSVDIPYDCQDDLPEMTQLQRSLEAGCGFCGLLRASMQRGISENESVRERIESRGGTKLTIKVAKVSVLASFAEPGYRKRLASIYVGWNVLEAGHDRSANHLRDPDGRTYFKLCAYSDDPLARYLGIAYPHPDQAILSAEDIEYVRAQLVECDTKHGHAGDANDMPGKGHGDTGILPTRLVEISGSGDEKKLRLVETASLIEHVNRCDQSMATIKYAALSYCWGHEEFLTTTASNLKEHLEEIPSSAPPADDRTSTVPQAFQDVVALCWELGIFYLWIDSLCIVQRDNIDRRGGNDQIGSDWAMESAKMHSIYSNAYISIVLAFTESPHVSVLKRQVDAIYPILPISYTLRADSGASGSFFIQPLSYTGELDHLVWHPSLAAEDKIDCSVWNTRGWTLQERLLSSRKLYIGANDMLGLGLFTCQRKTNFGQGLDPIKRPRRHKSLNNFTIDVSQRINIPPGLVRANQYHEWYRLVEDYTARNLTIPDDKLSALSGLARTQGLVLDDKYIAGLWVRSLHMGLLWAPRYSMLPGGDRYYGGREPRPFERPRTYRAPSWSWCSKDGEIEFIGVHLHNPRSEIEVLDCKLVSRHTGDPFGRLAEDQGDHGYLRLKARIRAFHMDHGCLTAETPTGVVYESTWLDLKDNCPDPEEVFLMIVSRGDRPASPVFQIQFESGTRSAGLILRKRRMQPRPEYERLGFYCNFWNAGITPLFDGCEPEEIYLV